jgi:hypothetical protein
MIATTWPELSSWYFTALASLVLVYGLPLVTAGASVVAHWAGARNTRKRALASRRAADEESTSLDVGDTIVHGRVEYAAGTDSAMRVVVEQTGTEAESSGSWTTTWTEVRRSVTVVPFYLVHRSGERVRVEPSRGAQFVGALPLVAERVDATHRTRIAKIAADEVVWITGVLTKDHDPEGVGGYRGASGWVMRSARHPMLISTEAPESRLLEDAARSRTWMIVFEILFVVMLLAHVQYHALVLFGKETTARVSGTGMGSCSADDDGINRCSALLVNVRVGNAFDDAWEVTSSAYTSMGQSTGKTVPAFACFGPLNVLSTSMPGNAPLALVWPTLLATTAWLGLALVASVRKRRKRWYDGARVVDHVSGRLAD